MAISHTTLLRLTAGQLKSLATQCGLNSSGTKDGLATRLLDEIHSGRSAKGTQSKGRAANDGRSTAITRVMSIDLGIKNFAYCILESSPLKQAGPMLKTWERRDISEPALAIEPASAPSEVAEVPKIKGTQAKTSFQPAAFASIAYDLVSNLLQAHNPDAVVLERQRFRTMGAAAVQEWTLRVNMLEAMLHAVLHTFKQQERWSGMVESVVPGKVGAFWTSDLGTRSQLLASKSNTKISSKLKMKTQKIDMVGQMLADGDRGTLRIGKDVEMVDTFLSKWRRMSSGRSRMKDSAKPENGGDIKKLDDVADSLLQGLAWLRWRENRELLGSPGGLDKLL